VRGKQKPLTCFSFTEESVLNKNADSAKMSINTLLVDREYSNITVCAPLNFSGQRLREKGIIVHREREALYGLGKTQVETNYGHLVNVYSMERTICDVVKNRKIYEVQTYQTALKEFFRKRNVDYSKLLKYATALNVKEDIYKYIEVMI